MMSQRKMIENLEFCRHKTEMAVKGSIPEVKYFAFKCALDEIQTLKINVLNYEHWILERMSELEERIGK